MKLKAGITAPNFKLPSTDNSIFELKKTKNCPYSLYFFIRFHLYPDTKIVKTQAGNSALISLTNGEGWLFQSQNNEVKIEKDIFFGNKNKIINNESISISDNINKDVIEIKWSIGRIN